MVDVGTFRLLCLIAYLVTSGMPFNKRLLSQLFDRRPLFVLVDAALKPSYVLPQAIDMGQDHILDLGEPVRFCDIQNGLF